MCGYVTPMVVALQVAAPRRKCVKMPRDIDDVLDRCRHGKTAAEACEEGEAIDLREQSPVDLTDEHVDLTDDADQPAPEPRSE